jgi:hypothetical protein
MRIQSSRPAWATKQDSDSKKPNRAGRVAQVVDRLPSKCEALSSNPSTTQKKKNCFQNITSFGLPYLTYYKEHIRERELLYLTVGLLYQSCSLI